MNRPDNRAKAIRFSTLAAISDVLECRVGDLPVGTTSSRNPKVIHPSTSPCHAWPVKTLFGISLIITLSFGTSGCGTDHMGQAGYPDDRGVCPAIGWSNSATVVLEGPVDAVAKVQFCPDGVCSVTPEPTTAPRATVTPGAGAVPGQATTAAPAIPGTPIGGSPYSPYFGRKVDARTWQFSTPMNAPESATVRALAAGGDVLAERNVDLTWTRVGGSEQCGGPATAGPIMLSLL